MEEKQNKGKEKKAGKDSSESGTDTASAAAGSAAVDSQTGTEAADGEEISSKRQKLDL